MRPPLNTDTNLQQAGSSYTVSLAATQSLMALPGSNYCSTDVTLLMGGGTSAATAACVFTAASCRAGHCQAADAMLAYSTAACQCQPRTGSSEHSCSKAVLYRLLQHR